MRKRSFSMGGEDFLDKLIAHLRFRKVFKKVPKNSRILDLGCGLEGTFLKMIQSSLKEGVGIDLNVNNNNRSTENKINLLAHNLEDRLPFKDNYFDIVTSLANLEHLTNYNQVLAEIHRVLKPGGTLFLTTPTIYAKPILEFMAFKLRIISSEEIRDHKKYFTKKDLKVICENLGFSEYNYRYFQFFMNGFLTAKK